MLGIVRNRARQVLRHVPDVQMLRARNVPTRPLLIVAHIEHRRRVALAPAPMQLVNVDALKTTQPAARVLAEHEHVSLGAW